MSARKWSKWPAPFKFGVYALCVLTIILSTTLAWSWNTYNSENRTISLPYESYIRELLSSLCEGPIIRIKCKRLSKPSHVDKTFLVTTQLANREKKKFVVKILNQTRWLPHRQYIMEVYRLGGLAGISPKVLFAEPEKGLLILEYINGRHISSLDLQNVTTIEKLGKILKTYHESLASIPYCSVTNTLTSRVKSRLEEIKTQYPLSFKLSQMVTNYVPLTSSTTVVHSDLKLSNVLITPQKDLYIIDWGEAHHGSPMIDLASLAHHGALSEALEKRLTQAYFQRPLTPAEKADLSWYKNLSLLHTSAWALRESGISSTLQSTNPRNCNQQRFRQLLHKFYQEGFLTNSELNEMGKYGILKFLQSTPSKPSPKSSLYITPEIN